MTANVTTQISFLFNMGTESISDHMHKQFIENADRIAEEYAAMIRNADTQGKLHITYNTQIEDERLNGFNDDNYYVSCLENLEARNEQEMRVLARKIAYALRNEGIRFSNEEWYNGIIINYAA